MSYLVLKTNKGVFATGDEGIKMLNKVIKEEVKRIIERAENEEFLKNIPNTFNKDKQISERDTIFVGEKGYKIFKEEFKKLWLQKLEKLEKN